ncbi:MAG TPA: alpha/beta hydrolase, partial [Rhodocyclaceae bacterium]|nr:alpha/beta hydrolase [Rhodocyclaceae bacterium]
RRVLGLVPISTFCEMPPQLMAIGQVFHMAITQVGFPMVQAMLLPMNFSSRWIEKAKALIPEIARKSYAINDPYAIQNLMESLNTFTPFAGELQRISCPVLILNGEYDYLTPRVCHETLRAGIKRSRLVIVQHGYHAITLEFPELTARLIDGFVRSVQTGDWPGDQSVWVASDDFPPDVLGYRCFGDHLHAIQAVD